MDLLKEGKKKYLKGDYKGAVRIYNKILKTDSDNLDALLHRGLAYLDLWKYDKAIEDFSKVIELDKNNKDAYRNRALAYYSLNKERLALDDYKRATELV